MGRPIQVAQVGKLSAKGAKALRIEQILKRGDEALLGRMEPDQADALWKDIERREAEGVQPGQPDPGGPAGPSAAGEPPFGEQSGINMRYATSLDDVDDPDALKNMIEATADPSLYDETPHTWDAIDAELDTPEKSIPVLKKALGKTEPWTDTQMHAAARMMATLGQEMVELRATIMAGQDSQENLLRFNQKASALQGLALTLRGKRREAARALAVNRKMATTIKAAANMDITRIAELSEVEGGREVMLAKVRMFNEAIGEDGKISLGELDRFTRKSRFARTAEAVAYVRNSMLLTGLETHMVNTISNAITGLYEQFAVRGMAAAIGGVRRLGGADAGDVITAGDILNGAQGSALAARDAHRIFARAWSKNDSMFGAQKTERTYLSPLSQEATGLTGRGGELLESIDRTIISAPYRLLGASDEMFKSVAYMETIYSEANRVARLEGLSGDAAKNRVAFLRDNPTEEMHITALRNADYRTYTKGTTEGSLIGATAQFLMKIREQNALTRLIFPFVQTPTNILEYGVENSALAPLTARWRQEYAAGGVRRDMALARLANGSIMASTMWAYYQGGNITGGGPADYGRRKTLEKTGWKPYAIRIGDTYYQYNRYASQFGVGLAAMADFMDAATYARDSDQAAAAAMGAVLSMGNFISDLPMMQGFDAIMETIDRREINQKGLNRFIASFYPQASKTVKQLFDKTPRRVLTDDPLYGPLQNIQAKTPWMSENLPPARYWDGEPMIPDYGEITATTGFVRRSTAMDDPPSAALIRNGIPVQQPRPEIRMSGFEIDLLALDGQRGLIYDKYIELVGQNRRKAIAEVIKDKRFKKLDQGPESEADTVLRSALRRGLVAGRGEFFKWLRKEAATNPDIHENAALVGLDLRGFLKRAVRAVKSGGKEAVEEMEGGDIFTRVPGTKENELPVPAPPQF